MDIAEFLQIYRHYPCLWDRSHVDFKDRMKRNEAEADILEMTEFTNVKELRNKIKNIRGTYTQEVNKIKASHASGLAEYKPKLSWFNVADSFLRKNYDYKESPEVDANDLCQTVCLSDYENKTPNIAVQNITKSNIKRPKKSNLESENISKVYASLNETVRIFKRISEQETNEYACFGKWIGIQLTKLPQNEAIRIQQEITNMVFSARLRHIDDTAIPESSTSLSAHNV